MAKLVSLVVFLAPVIVIIVVMLLLVHLLHLALDNLLRLINLL